MAHKASLAAAALVALLVAGCSGPSDSTTTTTGAGGGGGSGGAVPDAGTYTIRITVFDGQSNPHLAQDDLTMPRVQNGTDFQYTMQVEGSVTLQSEHIGGHFGMRPDPDATDIACIHTTGSLPGEYTVTCRAPAETGEYQVRGHARIVHDGANVDWWSPSLKFIVE